MQRATKIFHLEEREADSPFIDSVWRTKSTAHQSFISIAKSHWQIVVWRQDGETHVTVRGPETKATTLLIPADAEFMGVQIRVGAFMPDLPVLSLERRVRRATGLTLGAIRQIERVKNAADLLDRGATILDVGMGAGYADQAHLTRSLKRFMGQTPAQIAKEAE